MCARAIAHARIVGVGVAGGWVPVPLASSCVLWLRLVGLFTRCRPRPPSCVRATGRSLQLPVKHLFTSVGQEASTETRDKKPAPMERDIGGEKEWRDWIMGATAAKVVATLEPSAWQNWMNDHPHLLQRPATVPGTGSFSSRAGLTSLTSPRATTALPLPTRGSPLTQSPRTAKAARLASLDAEVLHSRRTVRRLTSDVKRWQKGAEKANGAADDEYRRIDHLHAKELAMVRSTHAVEMKTVKVDLRRTEDELAQARYELAEERKSRADTETLLKRVQQIFDAQNERTHKRQNTVQSFATKWKYRSTDLVIKRASSEVFEASKREDLAKQTIDELCRRADEHDAEMDALHAEVDALHKEIARQRDESRAASEAAIKASAKASDLGQLSGHEGMVRALAAKYFEGTVKPSNLESAIKRKFGIDIGGRLAELEEPLSKSREIFAAARAEIFGSSGPGHEKLMALPELRNPALCQQSDDFETVLRQADEAQQLLKSKVASSWKMQLDPKRSKLEVPLRGSAHGWVDEAESCGVKSRGRSVEKMNADYGGHAQQLKDLSRITLTYTDCERMADAVHAEMGASGLRIAALKNRFAHPTAMGYSDLNATVVLLLEDRTEYLVEILLNHPAMTKAKEEAHVYYEVVRNTIPDLCKNTDTDPNVLEQFLVDNLLPVDALHALPNALSDKVTNELARSALDFATDELMDKVNSLSDALDLGKQLEDMVEKHGHAGFDFEDIAKLKNAPDRQQILDQEAALRLAISQLGNANYQIRTDAKRLLVECEPGTLGRLATELITALKDEVKESRVAAAEVMCYLEPKALGSRTHALIARLEDPVKEVRNAAVATLRVAPTEALDKHARQILALLDKHASSLDFSVRAGLAQALGLLDPETLAPHAGLVVPFLEHHDGQLRNAATQALGKFKPRVLAKHTKHIVAKLKNTDWEVRQAVVETLGKLEPEMLAMCSDAIAAKLRDQSEVDIVRRTVMNTLGKLNPDKLQMHSMEIVATFESSDWRVRKATIETLSKLRPEEIAKQVDPKTIIAKLDQDHHENVREASADFLDTLICSQRAATFLQALSRGWLARIRRNEAKKLQDTLTPGKDIV